MTGLPLSVAALATSPMIETMLDGMTVGLEERITVGLLDGVIVTIDEGMTVGFEESVTVQTLDAITVGLDESVMVPEETEIADDGITVKLLDGVTVALEERVTPMGLPTLDSATTSADMVEVTALDPAVTQAVLPPLMIDTAPDETDVIVGLDERMTVGFDESVTVQTLDGMTVGFDERVMVPLLIESALDMPAVTESGPSVDKATTSAAMVEVTALDPATTVAWLAPATPPRMDTWLLPLTEIGNGPRVDRATTSADIVDVTVLDPATTAAVLLPFEIAIRPDEIVPTEIAELSVTVITLDGVTVTALDCVTVAEETATTLLVKVT